MPLALLRHFAHIFILLAVLASAGCIRSVQVTQRGGELHWDLERRKPVTLTFGKPSGCRVAFLPLVGAQFGVAAVAYANLALDSAMLVIPSAPGCQIISPAQVQDKLSRANLVAQYAQMQRDFDRVGLLDEAVIRRVADALGADVLVEGRLVNMEVDLQTDTFGQAAIAFVGLDRGIGGIVWTSFAGAKSVKVDTLFERTFVEQHVGFGPTVEVRGEQSIRPNMVGIADALAKVVQDAIAAASLKPAKLPPTVPLPTPKNAEGAKSAAVSAPVPGAAPAPTPPNPAAPSPQLSKATCDSLCEHVATLGATQISPGLCQRKCKDESPQGSRFRACAGEAKNKDDLLGCK